MRGDATIVMLHEHAGVLELIEGILRERGARVLGTSDAFEAAEIVRHLKIDLLLMSPTHRHVACDFRVLQSGVSAVVLDDEPMGLDEIAAAAVAALPPRERS